MDIKTGSDVAMGGAGGGGEGGGGSGQPRICLTHDNENKSR